MWFLYAVMVIWGGFDTRPSPFVLQMQSSFADQAACVAAANAIMAAPSITSPLPMAPKGMASEVSMICSQAATPAGGAAPKSAVIIGPRQSQWTTQ